MVWVHALLGHWTCHQMTKLDLWKADSGPPASAQLLGHTPGARPVHGEEEPEVVGIFPRCQPGGEVRCWVWAALRAAWAAAGWPHGRAREPLPTEHGCTPRPQDPLPQDPLPWPRAEPRGTQHSPGLPSTAAQPPARGTRGSLRVRGRPGRGLASALPGTHVYLWNFSDSWNSSRPGEPRCLWS